MATSPRLPAVPADMQVTAWGVEPPDAFLRLAPRETIIVQLHISWQRCQYYGQLLRAQVEQAANRSAGEAGGVVGHKTSASSVVGSLYPTGEEIRALARLEGQERDRCASLARQAHEMGLSGDDW